MLEGDPNDYLTENKTGWVQPVTKLVNFENKIKAVPTTFSFAAPPVGSKLFPYPGNGDPFRSDRLVGSAAIISSLAFDQMNARLGPTKRVNVVMVGMGDKPSAYAQYQESVWVGGKKNDVVIVWGGSNKAPTWVRAFGWTDTKICLRNLETIVLEHGAVDATLPLIEGEIRARYVLKDWEKSFAYIRVPVRWSTVIWFFIFSLACQIIYWVWAHHNEYDKETYESNRFRTTRYRY